MHERRDARGRRHKSLFILDDPPYGTERSYNALRLAGALAKIEGEEVRAEKVIAF